MSQNLEKLKKLLAELFQLDQADLDFGIYRIMNAKRGEITRFLDQDLLPQVREAFAAYESGNRGAVEAELAEAMQKAKDLGANPDDLPLVKELRARMRQATDITALENEVYSHLFSFFRRYYNEGDFISLRRYKEGVYAIPYEGEEVKLHWANRDQYYIKTTENFRDYTFKLPSGKRVHFKLVQADTERENNRAQNGKERRFILCEDSPVLEQDGELVIRFEYRPHAENAKQANLNAATVERVLSGTAGFDEWRRELSALRGTEKNPTRTLLEKHLADYTARNTFDYFIHKDLGEFLRRELDFYIKNEVMHLDDVESETAPRVEQYLSKIKAIRRIAHKLIDFLAQIEDFQKRLWLKKKFVVETQYCVTLDRIIAIEDQHSRNWFVEQILANDGQREEWVELFAIDQVQECLTGPGYSVPITRAFLEANQNLVVDTKFFGFEFQEKLILELSSVDSQLDGFLINGDNFNALSLLRQRYRGQLQCIYIDPPYNTDAGPIVYKNGYRSSSWATLIENRLTLSREFLKPTGVLCATIDDYQVHELAYVADSVFGRDRQLGVAVIRNNPSGRATVRGLSVCHEYAFFYGSSDDSKLSRLPRSEKQLARFDQEEGVHVDWRNFRKDGGAVTYRTERPKQYYPIYVDTVANSLRIPKLSWDKARKVWDALEEPRHGEVTVWPIDEKGRERVWSLNHESAEENIVDLAVRVSKGGKTEILRRHFPADGVLPRSWWDKNTYAAREHGSAALTDLFGESSVFTFAKAPEAVRDCIWVSGLDSESDELVMDYFGGSGTTAHAVIDLNRSDEGTRKYLLVEVGNYFDTVLLPRIKKVIYSKDWRGGVPTTRQGTSHFLKYIRLESYEDALNNLELKRTDSQQSLLDQHAETREDYMLRYMLDVETRGSASLLNVARFDDPFSYALNISTGTAGETAPRVVDLVETFNYLLGLRVKTMDTVRGVRVVTGLSPANERVLVLWRRVTETDSDALDAWFRKQGYNTKDQEFDVIYVNGDNNLENLRQGEQTWKVRLIEEEFHRLMFDVEDV